MEQESEQVLRLPPDEAYTQLKYSPFGFRIPGVVDESLILTTLKEISIKEEEQEEEGQTVEEKIYKRHQPSQLTVDDLTRELKREHFLQCNSNVKKQGEFYQIDAVDTKKLSETERSFYLAFNPKSNVPSDNEAQIQKSQQQSLKLVGAKESKQSTQAFVGSPIELNSSSFIAAAQPSDSVVNAGSGIKSGIVMQSQVTYQLNVATKNLVLEVKDPVILSPNIIERFCMCKKLYEGELMIRCENDKCTIMWYHPGCVGLGNSNTKTLEDIRFTCEECKKHPGKDKKGGAGAEKGSRKKAMNRNTAN